MVEVDAQTFVADALDELAEIGIEAVVALVLVVEWRQHQHAPRPGIYRMAGDLHGIGNGAGAGAGHQSGGRDTVRNDVIDQPVALRHRQ